MAAADYYNSLPAGNGPLPPSLHASRPQYLSPQQLQTYPQTASAPNHQPYQDHAPPPYQPVELPAEKPDRLPDPQYQRNSFSHPQRPAYPPWSSAYPQAKPPAPNSGQQPFFPPGQPYPQYQPQPFYQNPPPHLRPNHASHSSTNVAQGYSSDPEPHRRRRSRNKSKSRSTAADGFLGAAGGSLIGDMIFPGLGTIGGAALGYIGGKDYGKHRKGRESSHRDERGGRESKQGKRKGSRERRHS